MREVTWFASVGDEWVEFKDYSDAMQFLDSYDHAEGLMMYEITEGNLLQGSGPCRHFDAQRELEEWRAEKRGWAEHNECPMGPQYRSGV